MSADRVLAVLADRYRSDARRFRELGQVSPAELLERVAVELEDERETYESELMTVAQAAEESGYSESHIYHLLRAGQLPNEGQKSAPRIRRRDLPRKGTRLEADTEQNGSEPDLADELLEARSGVLSRGDSTRNRRDRPGTEKGKQPPRQRSRSR